MAAVITIRNPRLLRLLGFTPISDQPIVGMSWRLWLGVIGRQLAAGVR